eukprot:7943903-Pyramimonas_sp.AAC.1
MPLLIVSPLRVWSPSRTPSMLATFSLSGRIGGSQGRDRGGSAGVERGKSSYASSGGGSRRDGF